MKSKRVTEMGYRVSIQDGRLVIRWNTPLSHGLKQGDKGFYIYGRDYAELLNNSDLPLVYSKGNKFDPRAIQFNRLIANRLSGSQIHDSLRFSIDIENILTSGVDFRNISNASPESYLSRLRERFPNISPLLPLVRENIEVSRSTIVLPGFSSNVISLDAIEGTPFLLSLVNVVNTADSGRWLIYGPEKYVDLFQLTPIERPMLASATLVDIYSDASKTSLANAAERFDAWSTARFSSRDDKSITAIEAASFLSYTDSDEGVEELSSQVVPPQVAAPLNVMVKDGSLSKIDYKATFNPDPNAIAASCTHLINLIGDIRATGHLSNWTPGAQRKLERVSTHITDLINDNSRTVTSVTELGLDGQALKQIFLRTQEELSQSIIDEFSAFFLHLELLLAQFPAWAEFLDNAERVNWGRGSSQSYVIALEDVYKAVSDTKSGVDDGVRTFVNSALQRDLSEPTEIVAAASSVRNILSACSRYLLNIRDKIIQSGAKLVTEQISELSKQSLHAMIGGIGAQLLILAQENPRFFGWIEHAGRLLGWIK